MKLLLILLFHPTHIVRNRGRVPPILVHLAVLGYAGVVGLAFQYLYPRLLNNVPWLGFMRKFSITNWNPAFSMDYFLRGVGMGLWILAIYLVAYIPLHMAGRIRGNPFRICQLAALATAIPLLISCAVGFFFYYVDEALGLIPVYGFAASTCLQATIMRELFGVHRALVIHMAPVVMSIQAYGCFLLLP